MARGAKARGKRIAFGDGKQIIFSPWSEQIFRYNPNIAKLGSERDADIQWVHHYKGHRLYNSVGSDRRHWAWNMDFRPTPGEMFFTDKELTTAERAGSGFVLIEPNLPWHKSIVFNKDWGEARYRAVAMELKRHGYEVIQFWHGAARRRVTQAVLTSDFRQALAVLARAALYIGPEGGLHHGAAAVGIPAVVLFGGFIPPDVTGYSFHTNLTGGAKACGKLYSCSHCRQAMGNISIESVLAHARKHLDTKVIA